MSFGHSSVDFKRFSIENRTLVILTANERIFVLKLVISLMLKVIKLLHYVYFNSFHSLLHL